MYTQLADPHFVGTLVGSRTAEDILLYAKVLVELGDLHEAEREVAEVLDQRPDDLTALNLYAKIKHIGGELSQAVACWAQLHTRSPHNELALMCLGSILHLAKDPERGAGEFLALGRFQLARKPAAHLELEAAFRLFLARRPDEARAECDRLANKYKRRDRDLFKLAVLAKAWIAELSGNLEVACTVLEELGKERGFETDTDRVLGLARVYERLGTPDRLEKAVHIFRYLERSFEKISAQSRLAVLYRQLGQTQLAEECEHRYLEAFRRRMHRPSLSEVARVASHRYLPLEKLQRIRHVFAQVDCELPRRARAIDVCLRGNLGAARPLFEAGNDLLDLKYLANLAILEGRTDEGVRRFVSTLERDPGDLRVVSYLLAYHARKESPAIAECFRRPTVRESAAHQLTTALRSFPVRAGVWRDLATLHRILGDSAEATRCSERAAALQEAEQRDAEPIGRVLAAAVYHFIGKAKGLIHQIWMDRKPVDPHRGGFMHSDDILGNITPEMKLGIRNTFLAVREYARSRFPQQTADILDYNYTYKVTKEDEPSGGLSAGLPTALACLSVFLRRPVPQDIASSGVVIADAHNVLVVRHVGEAEYKVKAAYNRNLRTLILPADNRVELAKSAHVPQAICDDIVRYAAGLDEAVTLVFGEKIWTT